jgi:hypothetical protein
VTCDEVGKPAAAGESAVTSDEDAAQTKADIDAWFASVATRLTDAEVAAICQYRSIGYVSVNRLLREQDDPASYTEQELDSIESIIDGLDTAVAKSTLDTAVTVYRGVTRATAIFGVDALEAAVGADYTEPGFVSTSIDRDVALRTFVGDGEPPSALLEITVPPGANAIWVEGVSPSSALHEQEMLLPRGTKFVVRSVAAEKLPIIRLEVILD